MSLVHKSPFFAPLGICSGDKSFRQLYRPSLERLGKVREYGDLARVAENPSEGRVLVVDLDGMGGTWEESLEEARNAYAEGELIAVSGRDTAEAVLRSLRAGFSDYLLKPVSPEQLHWAVQRSLQRQDMLGRLQMGRNRVSRTVSRLSTAATPALVRQSLLGFVRQSFACEFAAWLSPEGSRWRVEAATPESPSAAALSAFPADEAAGRPQAWVKQNDTGVSIFFPCHNRDKGGICVGGLAKRPSAARMQQMALLLEYAEASLLNLESYEEIKRLTFVDDLSGLFNARYLKFSLPRYVEKSRATGEPFSVLFIDVDHFKSINDAHGHLVGSDFLVAIARTIKHAVRNEDPVFRYGGDEFVVILEGMGAHAATEIAERIRKHVERRIFGIRQKQLRTTVSIGVASHPTHAADVQALLQLADEAMYSVKRQSRNSVQLADLTPGAPRPPDATT